jgi:hypothetical protein
VRDYWNGTVIGALDPGSRHVNVSFEKFLLLEARPNRS